MCDKEGWETWTPVSRVRYNGVVDHRRWQPVLPWLQIITFQTLVFTCMISVQCTLSVSRHCNQLVSNYKTQQWPGVARNVGLAARPRGSHGWCLSSVETNPSSWTALCWCQPTHLPTLTQKTAERVRCRPVQRRSDNTAIKHRETRCYIDVCDQTNGINALGITLCLKKPGMCRPYHAS